jgi:hypothetical protein
MAHSVGHSWSAGIATSVVRGRVRGRILGVESLNDVLECFRHLFLALLKSVEHLFLALLKSVKHEGHFAIHLLDLVV